MGGRGSGGHNKKTIEQHVRDGTYRLDRHGPLPVSAKAEPAKGKTKRETKLKPAPQAAVLLPLECPVYFDEYARREFERVCQVLFDKGSLQDVNHATLEGYCAAYSRAVRSELALNKGFDEEVTFYTKTGQPYKVMKKKTEVAVAEKAWNQVKMFAVELGITSSRGKSAEEENLSPLEKALMEAERKPR